jgi:hypothetical protein
MNPRYWGQLCESEVDLPLNNGQRKFEPEQVAPQGDRTNPSPESRKRGFCRVAYKRRGAAKTTAPQRGPFSIVMALGGVAEALEQSGFIGVGNRHNIGMPS